MLQQIFNDTRDNEYDVTLVRLKLSSLQSRRRHLDYPTHISVFKSEMSYSSILDSLCLRMPIWLIRGYSISSAHYHIKVSSSATCINVRWSMV